MTVQAKASHFRGLRTFGRAPRKATVEMTKWLRTCTDAGDFIAPGGEPKATAARRPLADRV